jgi:hypothetical protein
MEVTAAAARCFDGEDQAEEPAGISPTCPRALGAAAISAYPKIKCAGHLKR